MTGIAARSPIPLKPIIRMITFIPVGGLANRMRAIASALTMAREASRGLDVVWFRDWALHAPFSALFEPITEPDFRLREAGPLDLLTLDRPRRRNLYIPALYQRLRYPHRIYEREVTPRCNAGFDFARWAAQDGRGYMASYSDFFPYPDTLLRRLFRPGREVREEVERRLALIPAKRVIGVHIRRTDNAESIAGSPMQLFFERIDAALDETADLTIYLATDSEEVKREVTERYGAGRVFTPACAADRSSTAGIRDGLADMFTLARTAHIYGSAGSTFSTMAARLGNTPITI